MRAAAAATLRQLPRVALSVPPRLRRRLLVALLLFALLFAGYRFWFRDSGFVSVSRVTVSGLTTSDAPRIRAALTAAAHDMTTLDVQRSALESSVASFPVVKSVEATPAFPHGLHIRVIEENPAAVLLVGGQRLLLSPDGGVLRGVVTGHPLPLIRSAGSPPQDRLGDGGALSALRVVAAAPAALAGRIASVGRDRTHGLVASLRSGPLLYFGDDTRVDAKWAAAAAVLADPSSRGASYVDVRLPERPVAGGLAAQTLAPLTVQGGDASAQSNAAAPPSGSTGTTGPQSAAGAPQAQVQTPQLSTHP